MRVVEARREAYFAEEPRAPERLGELGPQNLQRHVAVVAQIAREVDGRRGPGPDLALNAVPVAESVAEPVRHVRGQRASWPRVGSRSRLPGEYGVARRGSHDRAAGVGQQAGAYPRRHVPHAALIMAAPPESD